MSRGLGEILLDQGLIDRDQLAQAEAHRRAGGDTLSRSLVALGLVTEVDLVRAFAAELGMSYVDVAPGAVDPTAAEMIPRSLAQAVLALPVRFGDGNELVVAVSEPNNDDAKRRIEDATGVPVRLALTTRGALVEAITRLPDDGGSGRTPIRLVESDQPSSVDLDELLGKLVESEGSDLHLSAGIPPAVRVHGELHHLEGYPPLDAVELRKMIYAILTQKQREAFENELELDTSYALANRARFRVNVFRQRDAVGAVMRVIPYEIKPLDTLGVPAQVANFAYLPRGFVVVTGPTGSGKSTTLASLIDLVNTNRAVHIMTIEDPIEFLHQHKRSVVNQREVGSDTHGFAPALKHVLRQDPDVILVGELRDLETIQIALTAAETGHLVFATLHTQDAPQTIDRIIDVFPPHQQEQIRVQLAGALQGVVAQQLLKTKDGKGRTVACEVMVATSAVRNLIREGKTHQIYSSIQAGAQHGMVAMDQSLANLVKAGKVDYDEALGRSSQVLEFNRLAGR